MPKSLGNALAHTWSDSGRKDVLVPVGCDVLLRQHAPVVTHEVVAVDLQVFQQLEIQRRTARRESDAGTRLRQAAVFQEDPLQLPQDDLDHVGSGRKRYTRDELRHIGVDHLATVLPRKCNAVVPVDDEVHVAELDGDDRREVAARKRCCECTDPVATRFVSRYELPRKRRLAPFGADDVGQRDRLDAERAAADRREPALDVAQRK